MRRTEPKALEGGTRVEILNRGLGFCATGYVVYELPPLVVVAAKRRGGRWWRWPFHRAELRPFGRRQTAGRKCRRCRTEATLSGEDECWTCLVRFAAPYWRASEKFVAAVAAVSGRRTQP